LPGVSGVGDKSSNAQWLARYASVCRIPHGCSRAGGPVGVRLGGVLASGFRYDPGQGGSDIPRQKYYWLADGSSTRARSAHRFGLAPLLYGYIWLWPARAAANDSKQPPISLRVTRNLSTLGSGLSSDWPHDQ